MEVQVGILEKILHLESGWAAEQAHWESDHSIKPDRVQETCELLYQAHGAIL